MEDVILGLNVLASPSAATSAADKEPLCMIAAVALVAAAVISSCISGSWSEANMSSSSESSGLPASYGPMSVSSDSNVLDNGSAVIAVVSRDMDIALLLLILLVLLLFLVMDIPLLLIIILGSRQASLRSRCRRNPSAREKASLHTGHRCLHSCLCTVVWCRCRSCFLVKFRWQPLISHEYLGAMSG